VSSKTLVLVALAIVSFMSGAVDQYFYPGVTFPPTAMVYMVLGLLLLFAWYRLDADQRGYRRSPFLNVGVILFAIVALPYYFFRSRGAKGGFLATGAFLGAYVVCSALLTAGIYAAYYGLQA